MASASEPKPIVRVVLAGVGDPPAWFDGFVKHLRSELALRGIDVVAGGPGPDTEAELVVEVPSAQKPLLRFMAPGRDAKQSRQAGAPERLISLSSVPADGRALALAVAADELMRSNWSRARVFVAADGATDASHPTAPEEPAARANEAKPAAEAKPAGETKPAAEAKPITEAKPEGADITLAPTPDADDAPEPAQAAKPRSTNPMPTAMVRAALAAEIFSGGQTEVGPDVRFALRPLSMLELELRGGFRSLLARDAPSGSVSGTALVGGGGVHWIVARNARAAIGFVGRFDLLSVRYTGTPRDVTVAGSEAAAFGVVLAAGGSVRWALSKWLSAQGELLAGGSAKSATATADFAPTMSTSGLAVLASAGLSVGF